MHTSRINWVSLLIIFFAIIYSVIFSVQNECFAQPKIYWVDSSTKTISNASLTGQNPQVILNFNINEDPQAIAIDDKHQKIYWIDASNQTINQANLDGSSPHIIVADFSTLTALAVDQLNDKLYWSNSTGIVRGNLDGTGSLIIVTATAGQSFLGITVNPLIAQFFWTSTSAVTPALNFIQGASTQAPITPRTIGIPSTAYGIAESVIGNKVFTASPSTGKIETTDNFADNAMPQNFITNPPPSTPKYIAIDFPETHIYWSDRARNAIMQSDLNAPSAQVLLNVQNPAGVAVDCGIFAPDNNGDGIADCLDLCPNDPAKVFPDVCGCGVADIDSDGDGAPDCYDLCPDDNTKFSPDFCGCNLGNFTSDPTTVINCLTQCFSNPSNFLGPNCGCGGKVIDIDKDGTADCEDVCPLDPRKIVAGDCGCGQIEDLSIDGQNLCFTIRSISPFTKIKAPPAVAVKKNSATIIMESFSGASLTKASKAMLDSANSAIELLAAKKNAKVSYQYEIQLKSSGAKIKSNVNALSKKNEFTFKNLKPGKYSASYRGNILKGGKVVAKTGFSPAAKFTIP